MAGIHASSRRSHAIQTKRRPRTALAASREDMTTVTERSLLAALIAGLILPSTLSAQTSDWDCRATAQGGWDCTPGAADGTAESSAEAAQPATPSQVQPEPISPDIEPAPPTAAPAPAVTVSGAANAASTPAAVATDNPWALCRVRAEPDLPPAELTGTDLAADNASIEQGVYTLTGAAEIERAGQRIRAERIRYDETQGLVEADGQVQLDETAMRITGSRAALLLDSDQGEISDVEYEVYAQHARGRAGMARQDSKTHKTFIDATYTTCDAPPADKAEPWRLNAREVQLDEADGTGTGRHVWLELADIPVLYTPYISFPIDDRRKSGLLIPSWGNSDTSGAEFALPYYWNIAPHRDATITPRVLSKRGVQMQTEFRYLNPYNSGTLNLEYLPSDSEYNDEDRRLLTIAHSGQPMQRVRTQVRAADVSDDQYFEDLGTSLDVSSITHLERLAEATYFGDSWSLTGRAQDYQTIDSTLSPDSRPYKRLPQVLFQMRPRREPYGLQFSLDTELVKFDQDGRETGSRFDLLPKVAMPLGGAAWFVTPSVGLRHTQYKLDDRSAGLPDDPDRTTPIVSLDSGLFFERSTTLFDTGLLQTLEPRLFYLHVPNKDQSELPVFDTGLRDFNFAQMFEDNRFSGADRMGDADQLTVAVTSRLLDPVTGTQHASFSLGEVFYFRDRAVTLPGDSIEDQSSSNLVAEMDLRLSPSWKFITGLQWDPFESKTERSSLRLQYRPDRRQLWNFAYRYRSGELEQIDTSALWYFTPRWHGVMRWNYSLPERELLETLAGLEYESCCWTLRLLGRSFVNETGGERNDAVLVQLELKGLTSIGDPIESLLEDGILGYSRD